MAKIQQAAGLQNPLQNVFPQPVVSQRAPTAADKNYPIGQEWIDKTGANAYILVNVLAGSATWNLAASTAGELNTLGADSGTSTPASGEITIAGGSNATTSATGSTVTVNVDTSLTTLTSVSSLSFDTDVATASLTISGKEIEATGTDTDISIDLTTKGTGVVATSGGITAATGNITATSGDFVCSAAGTGIAVGGGAKVVSGTGDPNTVVTAPQGSLYLRLDGSSTSTRAYINTDGATAWADITTGS